MARALVLLVAVVGPVVSAAGDPPADAAPAPAPSPPSPQAAADAVFSALTSNDSAALTAIAARTDPDPWLVADELLARGEEDAAEAFARAVPGTKDTERLAEYVAWRRGKPDDAAARAAFAAAIAAGEADPALAAAAIEGVAGEHGTVVAIRLARRKAWAAHQLVRLEESTAGFLAAAQAGEEIGWLSRAADDLIEAVRGLEGRGDFTRALEVAERLLQLEARRGAHARVVEARRWVGLLAFESRDVEKAQKTLEQALAEAQAAGTRGTAAWIRLDLGKIFQGKRQSATAVGWYERAASEFEALGDHRGIGAAFYSLGLAHRILGNGTQAGEALERARREWEAAGNRTMAAAALADIGSLHAWRGDHAKAIEVLERAIALHEEMGNRWAIAWTLDALGDSRRALGHEAEAIAAFERARREMAALGNRVGAAAALADIGLVSLTSGNAVRAREVMEQAQAELESLDSREDALVTLGNLGAVYNALGEFAKAIETYERALRGMQEVGDHDNACEVLRQLGHLHKALGNPAKCIECWEHALREAEACEDRRQAALTLDALGSVYHGLGRYAKALEVKQRALAQSQSVGDRAAVALVMTNLGAVHTSVGNYAEALEFLGGALAESLAIGVRSTAAYALGNLGALHAEDLGDIAKGIVFTERALSEMEAIGDRTGIAWLVSNLGSMLSSRGEAEQALALLQRALQGAEAAKDRWATCVSLKAIGDCHLAMGEHAMALEAFERALRGSEESGAKAQQAALLAQMGKAHLALGDAQAARAAYERSERGAKSLRAGPIRVDALEGLARVHLAAGEPAPALSRAREGLRELEDLLEGLSEEEGAGARHRFDGLFEAGAVAAVRVGDPAEVGSFLESGRAGTLLDSLDKREVLRWKAESLPPALLEEDRQARAAEAVARRAHELALSSGDRARIRVRSAELDEAIEGVREVSAKIQREARRQAGLFYPRPRTTDDLRATLAPGEALVLYGIALREAFALLIRPEDERLVPLGSRDEVEAACEALAASDLAIDPAPALERLRALLVAPLELAEGTTTVIVSPEGPLCYLPFGALFDRAVALAPSGTTHALLRDERLEAGTGVLALGDPDYLGSPEGARAIYHRGRPLVPLPATRAEAETVGTTTLLGARANEAELRDALRSRPRWRAVHLACHGLVDPDRPLLSSLALSAGGEDDGFLTALEILRTPVPADLVALSACETARGRVVKGEGIVGLARAFMFAGAPRVLCSLWKVEDEATRALMTRLYAGWNAGASAAAALREAQASVRAEARWSHPYYWAGWVLWGLP